MDTKTRILIVEDDMIIAANISLQLTKLGYEVTGIESRGEEAILHARANRPDIILMDINLKGALDGIATVRAIQQNADIAIIYLSANGDEETFSQVRSTHPLAFIAKPFNTLAFERTIALAVEQLREKKGERENPVTDLAVMSDRIFVRHNGKLTKLLLEEIQYVEADRNYCNIVTQNCKYLVVSTLKAIDNELSSAHFIRVHRSYIVNVSKVDVVTDNHLEIGRKVIPLSKSYKEALLGRLHLI